MTKESNNAKALATLNTFRAAEGKAPFADWRSARHTPMLDAYLAAQAAAFVEDEERADPADEGANADLPVVTLDIATARVEALSEVLTTNADLPVVVLDSLTAVVEHAAEVAPAPVDAPKAKAPSYKDFANYDKSSVVKPVEYVHTFLDANPSLTRKAAVQALVEAGINYSTARTQYQRWFSGRKG